LLATDVSGRSHRSRFSRFLRRRPKISLLSHESIAGIGVRFEVSPATFAKSTVLETLIINNFLTKDVQTKNQSISIGNTNGNLSIKLFQFNLLGLT